MKGDEIKIISGGFLEAAQHVSAGLPSAVDLINAGAPITQPQAGGHKPKVIDLKF